MEQKMTFEESVARLDAIVRQMEQGNVPLQQALDLFSEGTQLLKSCNTMLDEAQLQVVKLVKSPDGTPTETEYVRDE